MKIVIAGGTGFLGGPLAEMYAEDGNEVFVLSRSVPAGEKRHDPGTGVPGITRVGWVPDGSSGPWSTVLENADALVNLAGERLDAKRWNERTKAQMRDSRILATRSLVAALRSVQAIPAVFISGSAVGYYGACDSRPLSERDSPGQDFLAQLCVDWEKEALPAASLTRVVLIRTGIVLERSGGALPEMMKPFRFFAGGPLGSGRQYVSWVHRLDWVEMVRWLVQTPIGPRTGQRHGAASGDQPSARARNRPRHAASQPAAGAGVRLESGGGRVRRVAGHRPARHSSHRPAGGLSFSVSGAGSGVQGDVRGVVLPWAQGVAGSNPVAPTTLRSPGFHRGSTR